MSAHEILNSVLIVHLKIFTVISLLAPLLWRVSNLLAPLIWTDVCNVCHLSVCTIYIFWFMVLLLFNELLYNDMLWVVMNMLCFVSFLLMVCWNLCIPYGKNWNLHIAWLFRWILGEFRQKNAGCHCIIVIKHGLLCFVTLMYGCACID